MNHWMIFPILLPAVVAPLIVLAIRNDIVLARIFSIGCSVALLMVGGYQFGLASDGVIRTYAIGNWSPPFGIVLVLDRLSATMLLLTAVIGLFVLLYSITGWDNRGRHFHPLFQFQLMGLNGAFLTGDLFNLFVFFEVLLIASYGLMVHGGGGATRIRAGIQYVVMNLTGSSLFLIAIALIYSATGTLNMADLSRKIHETPAATQAILSVGGALLFIVFALKSALFPLHLWLPGTYANAPGPAAALFSIMTKVGVYSIVRLFTLSSVGLEWVLPAALATLMIGSIGVLASRSLGQQASFATLASMGTLFVAISGSNSMALSAGLYYLIHSTLCVAGIFLIVDLVIVKRPGFGDALVESPKFPYQGIIACMFFAFAVALSGVPPLSGFIGKILVLKSTQGFPNWHWIWLILFVTSFVGLVGMARSGSLLFWKCNTTQLDVALFDSNNPSPQVNSIPSPVASSIVLQSVAIGCFFALIAMLSVFASPVSVFMKETAEQLYDSQKYVDSVLGKDK
ncbi:MAG: monovalent cation/H+ antiporter subunit D [Planctomycetota bacterium]|nr:monovalent cation/H+ antiporter subunit D [Planctomycetota bacterium]